MQRSFEEETGTSAPSSYTQMYANRNRSSLHGRGGVHTSGSGSGSGSSGSAKSRIQSSKEKIQKKIHR